MTLPYLIEKEFKQMRRNIVLPIVFVLLPVAMVNVVPRLATQEVRNVRFCALDADHSTLSTRLINKLAASAYFNLTANVSTHTEALALIKAGEADIALEIGPDFERTLIRTGSADVALQANATDGMKSGLGVAYASQIIADFADILREEQNTGSPSLQQAATVRYLHNVSLDYKTYMIPGLIGMVLVLLVGFLPALNIVSEKENGTIEQINVTPVGKTEFIFSKLIPYWVVGLTVLGFCIVLATVIHGVSPKGNLGTLLVFATLFILVISSLGLIVSNISDTTQQASLVMFFFLVIFLLMSGLLTPITSMPPWAQNFTLLNPFRWFMEAIRAIYLKGSGLTELTRPLIALGLMAATLFPLSVATYNKGS